MLLTSMLVIFSAVQRAVGGPGTAGPARAADKSESEMTLKGKVICVDCDAADEGRAPGWHAA